MDVRSCYATVLGWEIHYLDWGDPAAEAVMLWHGLARTGRDFDILARHLSRRWRVICPDMIGRGLSQWSRDPERDYCFAVYSRIAAGLADILGLGRFRWLGTSMGGACGIVAAAGPLRERISHLVLNDIGPQIAPAAVARIRAYAGNPPRFDRLGELEAWFRTIYRPFGAMTDAEWRHLAETSARRCDDGRVAPHYDPRMVCQFTHHPQDYDRWPDYDRVTARTLCLRGAESDLLLPDAALAMTRRGPRCRLEVVPGCGHTPQLNVPDQIALVADFLAEPA